MHIRATVSPQLSLLSKDETQSQRSMYQKDMLETLQQILIRLVIMSAKELCWTNVIQSVIDKRMCRHNAEHQIALTYVRQ